ncbi:MAG: restriction endonuclease [Patescibacteria group bacterium]|nr:restriction endonuclease [Patescibacteria group bacterium]
MNLIQLDFWQMLKIIFSSLSMAWPIFLLMGAFFIAITLFELLKKKIDNDIKFNKGKSWRTDQELLQWLRGLKPTEFEEYIAHLFTKLGYKADAVGKSHDGGIDVIATKNGITNYIQCKKYITNKVPVSAVRDFYGALANKLANGKGYIITTNTFTLEAEKFAEDKPIELIDGFDLIRHIKMAKKNSTPVTIAENNNSNCPKCGGTLVKRNGKFGEFKGCSNYPKCKYTTK